MTMEEQMELPGMPTNYQRGYQHKYEVQTYLREYGLPLVSRELGTPGDDLYDLTYSVECKNTKEISLSSFVDQAQRNAGNRIPVVVIKRRGKHVRESYVVMTLATFTSLVT